MRPLPTRNRRPSSSAGPAAVPTAAAAASQRASGTTSSFLSGVRAALALDAERRLGLEPGAKALERGDERVDLVERVLPLRSRADRELEVDRVHAVGDAELHSRRRDPMPAHSP